MFFEFIKQGDSREIDGTKYVISMQANVENSNCREALFNIHKAFEEGILQMECTFENYTTWKKDL